MKQELTPTIQIDTREQNPLRFENLPSERATLPVGGYGVRGFSDWENPAFIIERKNLEDLCHRLGKDRERFLRECEKMRAFRFKALVIEAVQDQVELAQYRSLPVGAERKVESLAAMFARGIEKDFRRLAFVPALKGENEERQEATA